MPEIHREENIWSAIGLDKWLHNFVGNTVLVIAAISSCFSFIQLSYIPVLRHAHTAWKIDRWLYTLVVIVARGS